MAAPLSSKPRPGRVILWAPPRTIGTAFCKCMSGVPDSEIWYEPYCFAHTAAAYLKQLEKADLPMEYSGNEEIFQKAVDCTTPIFNAKSSPEMLSYAHIKNGLETSSSKYVFVKDEAVGMASEQELQYLPSGYRHSFIIRHPDLIFQSVRKATYKHLVNVKMLKEDEDESSFDMREYDEFFEYSHIFQDHYNMWKFVRANIDPNPIVIEANDVQTKTAETLSKYCEAVGLPYSDSLLKWDGSVDSGLKWKMAGTDFIYNSYFMGVSMTSTHFIPPRPLPPRDQLSDDVIEMADNAMPLYKEMYKSII